MKIVNLYACHTKLIALAFLSVFVASGCTIVPKPIDVAKNENLVPFGQISAITQQAVNQEIAAPASISQIGEKARWGGKIVSVENRKEFSEIEVVFFPENSFGKPRTGQPSIGRFKAIVKGFVDPIVFEQGRLITIVGEIGDAQTGIIGEQEYNYPTLNAMGYHMWKQTSDVQVDTFAFAPFGYYSSYHRGFFSPWYDPWHFRTQRHRVRLTHNNGHEQGARVRGGMSPQTPTSSRNSRPVGNVQIMQNKRQRESTMPNTSTNKSH